LSRPSTNPHILNPNGSNALHILFANFQFGDDFSELLSRRLISLNLDLNLIDNNGLSPIHVAIKKNQISALEFAVKFNQERREHL